MPRRGATAASTSADVPPVRAGGLVGDGLLGDREGDEVVDVVECVGSGWPVAMANAIAVSRSRVSASSRSSGSRGSAAGE